jgi:hypothetical protein
MGAARHEVLGLMVQGGTGEWRMISVAPEGRRYQASEWSGLPDDAYLQPLPNHPQPLPLQSFVANTLLGGHRSRPGPLTARNAQEQPLVAQWAMLKLIEQFGCLWRDPERRGDLVRTNRLDLVFPTGPTVLGRLPAAGPAGESTAVTVGSPPLGIGPAELGNWNARSGLNPAPNLVRNLSGSLDEFALFIRALSDAEIRELYAQGKSDL